MQLGCVADAFGEPEPDLLEWRALGRLQFVARIDMAELERAFAIKPALHLRRQMRERGGVQRRRRR